jgi:hypothetical protein
MQSKHFVLIAVIGDMGSCPIARNSAWVISRGSRPIRQSSVPGSLPAVFAAAISSAESEEARLPVKPSRVSPISSLPISTGDAGRDRLAGQLVRRAMFGTRGEPTAIVRPASVFSWPRFDVDHVWSPGPVASLKSS